MQPFSLNIRGRLTVFDRPAVMAIVNATPDSFYAESRCKTAEAVADRVRQAIAEGADLIDIGAYSSRPGAENISVQEEVERLIPAIEAARAVSSDAIISVDTFRADVARKAVEAGADIINDISGGLLDPDMIGTVADLHVPYILMHMRGSPETMQTLTKYPQGVTAGVIAELAPRLEQLSLAGVNDVIVDPGFGFSKTIDQNYTLLRDLNTVAMLGRPVLVGLSRKSMATRLLGIFAEEALPATVALDTLAIERGASIIRVHDVAAARQTVDIITRLREV